MATVLAKDAEPGVPYRVRHMLLRGMYYEVTPVATVRRLAKKAVSNDMRTDELRHAQAAKEALAGKVVLLTQLLRGTSHEGRYECRLGYVAVPPDYPLRVLKARPGYT